MLRWNDKIIPPQHIFYSAPHVKQSELHAANLTNMPPFFTQRLTAVRAAMRGLRGSFVLVVVLQPVGCLQFQLAYCMFR